MAITAGSWARHKAHKHKVHVEKVKDGNATCTWLDDNRGSQSATYALDSLEEVEDKPHGRKGPLPKVVVKDPHYGSRKR